MDIQERLSSVEGLQYIDKNWGQLSLEQPAVKFPCALVDIENVTYNHREKTQFADASMSVMIAGLRLGNSSAKSNAKADSWKTLDMVRSVNDALHQWNTERFNKLIRTGLRKVECAPGYDCYELTYHLTFWDSVQS